MIIHMLFYRNGGIEMFTVDNKFKLNQQVYVIQKETKRIDKKQTCEICSGIGNIVFKGYKMFCPKCNGKKEIITDSKMTDIYSVDKELHTITSIRYSITRQGNYLKYRIDGNTFNGRNITEDMMFLTMEEAIKACDDLNMFVRYDEYGEKLLKEMEEQNG